MTNNIRVITNDGDYLITESSIRVADSWPPPVKDKSCKWIETENLPLSSTPWPHKLGRSKFSSLRISRTRIWLRRVKRKNRCANYAGKSYELNKKKVLVNHAWSLVLRSVLDAKTSSCGRPVCFYAAFTTDIQKLTPWYSVVKLDTILERSFIRDRRLQDL